MSPAERWASVPSNSLVRFRVTWHCHSSLLHHHHYCHPSSLPFFPLYPPHFLSSLFFFTFPPFFSLLPFPIPSFPRSLSIPLPPSPFFPSFSVFPSYCFLPLSYFFFFSFFIPSRLIFFHNTFAPSFILSNSFIRCFCLAFSSFILRHCYSSTTLFSFINTH